jgi:hypothetical protein
LRDTKIAGVVVDAASMVTSVSQPSAPVRLNTIRPL